MAQIRWEVVRVLQHIHALSDRRLARDMGISAAHYCDVKRGYRKATIEFIDLLVEKFRLNYDRLIVHPSVKVASPLPPQVGITHQENGAKAQRLCQDPDHWEELGNHAQARREREATKLIPVRTRKKLYPKRW